MNDHPAEWEEILRKYMSWFAVGGATLFSISFFSGIIIFANIGFWDQVLLQHFAAGVGLPAAALAAIFEGTVSSFT